MAFLYHARNNGLRHDERRIEVDVDNLTEVFNRHFCHRYALDDAGVVYKDVYCAEFFLYVGNHLLNLVFFCNVADISFGVDALSLIVGQSLVHVVL